MKYLFLFVALFFSTAAFSSVDIFQFDSIEQEKRYKNLVFVLRCPTCQNQNLSDSNSMVADDLKLIVYEKIKAGESDEQILRFMKQRYGEFILYEPELSPDNLFLWVMPLIFFIVFFVSFLLWYQRQKGEIEND